MGDEDFLEQLMKKLATGENGEVGGGEDALLPIMEQLMGTLLSKETLYHPLKDLLEKVSFYSI